MKGLKKNSKTLESTNSYIITVYDGHDWVIQFL